MIGRAAFLAALALVATAAVAQPEVDDARSQVHAAEALLDGLASDASDSAVLVGVPTEQQRARVRSDATEALAACIRAAEALTRAIGVVESDPAFFDDPALRDLRSQLAVEYNTYRLPMARGRAALLLAATDPQHRRAPDLLRVAVDSVLPLDVVDPVFVARRELVIALAAQLGGQVDGAVAMRASEGAFALARDIAIDDPHTSVEATLQRPLRLAQRGQIDEARRLLVGAAGSPPFVREDGLHEPAWRLLLADAEFRVERRAAAQDSGQLAQITTRRAYNVYESFLKDDRLPTALPQRRAMALGRLVGALPANANPDSVPPLALIALATRRAGEAGYSDESIRWLAIAAENRPVEDLWMRAELRFALATQLLARAEADPAQAYADQRRAMLLLTAIGAECPDWPEASVAVEAACRIATRLPANALEDHDAIDAALRLAVTEYQVVPTIDRWRLALAARTDNDAERIDMLTAVSDDSEFRAAARVQLLTLAVEDLRTAPDSEQEALATAALVFADDVRAALGQGRLSAEAARSVALRTDVLAIEAHLALGEVVGALDLAGAVAGEPNADRWLAPLSDALERMLRAAPPEETIAVAEMLIEACNYRLQSEPPEGRANDIRATLALAFVAAGRPDQAAPILDELRTSIGPRLDILRAGAEAAYALGDDQKAFAMYRQIVTPLEGDETPGADFWLCWSRMLQILGRQNVDGSRTETIRREILRLRTIDPDLGGEPYASRIRAVEASH